MRIDPWLAALCASRTLLTLVFMTYAASLPVLRGTWGMSATAAGSISTGFQLGYAVSLVLFSALADRIGPRRVYLASGWLSAATAVVWALGARSYLSALILYTLVALSVGGTYTTAIMLIADRYPSDRRGSAVGWLIASASLGYALSLLISGVALAWGGYPLAFLATAVGPLLGVLIAAVALRWTPDVVHPRTEGLRFGTEVIRNGPAMRLILGYTFHSWEVLGMWAWTPAFLAASLAASGAASLRAVELGAYVSSSFHVVGLVASSSMGGLSDRLGHRLLLIVLAGSSAACSFVFGWLLGWPIAVLFVVGAVYGFTALGDSPVLSAALTEAVRAPYRGAALALRSFLGFGAGAIAPLLFGAVLDATNAPGGTPGVWGWAFVTLGAGGLAAVVCAYGLPRSAGGALGAGSSRA
ncbi:MAG: MFS transporter [Candidatus Rokubacteria bacterium]|nr:MFS transporter [Candidatus Rokubacteria bacterium]